MAKKRRQNESKKKHSQGKKAYDKGESAASQIIMPRQGLILPASPFEQRMRNHPLTSMLSRNHPEYDEIAARINRVAEMDIAFQAEFRNKMRRLPLWAFARSTSGSGFLMASTLRYFFIEYLDRLIKHGPDSMPSSFNVVESFMSFNDEFRAFDVRPEKEHLLHADDYFEWYAQEALPRDPRLVMDGLEDGTIYSFDMAGDSGGYRVTGKDSTFVLGGISLVRHSNELSCLLVAGENPPNPSDKEIKKMEALSYESMPGKETLEPHPELSISSRYLDRYPKFARVHLLTRFDLSCRKYNVRYVNIDTGRSYNVLTDDATIFDDLDSVTVEKLKKQSLAELARYDSLFSALASLIYLPLAFIDEREHTQESTFKTEFDARKSEEFSVDVIKEFDEPVYMKERTVKCLATGTRSGHASKNIVPPEMEFERDGYWRPLAPGEVGKDQDGHPTAGRTWVSRLDSWSAQSPSTFLLERPDVVPYGDDPGIVYIVRSGSHQNEIYKVGLTRRTAEKRVEDLSKTSAPLPFGILAQWNVGDCMAVEQEVHRRLDAYRVNPNREFFHCDLAKMVATVQAVISELPAGVAGAR